MGPIFYILIALPCTIGAIALALLHIYMHLMNYTEPIYQRYIVRIIFMVPVYALMSFLALVINKGAIYFNSIREVYEAWVIYNFLSLCLAWVGGPGAVVLSLSGKLLKPNCWSMTCCIAPVPLDGRFIRRCKQGCLQFVILKPMLVAVTFILYAKGKYEDGNFSPMQSYLYLTIIYTISYSAALYVLALFYVACRDLLQPFNPVPKFIIIKSVVFLTYWQVASSLSQSTCRNMANCWSRKTKYVAIVEDYSDFMLIDCDPPMKTPMGVIYKFQIFLQSAISLLLLFTLICVSMFLQTLWFWLNKFPWPHTGVLVFLAAKSDLIKDTVEAANFQSFIICVEMLIAAVGHLYAFPYKDYAGANIGASRGFTASLTHALKLNDFYHDTVHQFAPTYHDYVLYNHNDGDEGTRKYRARTFVPTGPEMDAVRRNKHMFGNKSEDVHFSSLSSPANYAPQNPGMGQNLVKSEAVNTSLLMDASSTLSVPYDLSLIDLDMSNNSAKVPAAK